MPKGIRQHGPDIEFAFAELIGSIRHQIILFSAEIGVSALWASERISTLLSPQRERLPHYLPDVREAASGRNGTMEPLALAGVSRSSDTPPTIESEPSTGKKRSNSAIREYWKKMSPQQRAAVMRDKLIETSKKRALTPGEKKRLETFKVKAGKTVAPEKQSAKKDKEQPKRKSSKGKTLSEEERAAKQKIYVQRHAAKKRGEKPPPLPSEVQTAA